MPKFGPHGRRRFGDVFCSRCYEFAEGKSIAEERQMAKVTFSACGARSGKSAHAEALALDTAGRERLVYVATAEIDDEMSPDRHCNAAAVDQNLSRRR